jgi:hypothetical protein
MTQRFIVVTQKGETPDVLWDSHIMAFDDPEDAEDYARYRNTIMTKPNYVVEKIGNQYKIVWEAEAHV